MREVRKAQSTASWPRQLFGSGGGPHTNGENPSKQRVGTRKGAYQKKRHRGKGQDSAITPKLEENGKGGTLECRLGKTRQPISLGEIFPRGGE